MIAGSFLIFLGLFTLIGIASVIKSRRTTQDYLLAGHTVKPWLVGLSAVATNNSGFMFTGMIGYTYTVGLASIWIIVPWILGDLLTSFFVHKRLRIVTEKQNTLTFSGTLSRWHGNNYTVVRRISAIIIIVFLVTYAAAQLSAGSKALHVLFDWDYKAGAIIGSVIVLAYCFAGGIRASIWTDAAQSAVMVAAMGVLSITAIQQAGGWSGTLQKLNNVSEGYMSWFPPDIPFGSVIGGALLILGWTVGGMGVIGQPHIMVRFMTMNRPEDMARSRLYYYGWYGIFCLFTLAAGFAARILLPEIENFDSELALPILAKELLPSILVGLILAGLFAATMSTADSQILSCSAAFNQDLKIGRRNSYIINKLGTAFMTLTALLIALYGSESVFGLVLIAWSALGSAFAPLMIVYVSGGRPSQKAAVTMIVVGITAMLLWKKFGFSATMYEIVPGIAAGLLSYAILKWINRNFGIRAKELL